MSADANSVNIKSAKPKYHHGDLRAELVRIGLEHLSRSASDALSLREIARDAGVSATAVYRHFPDKASLLKALCVEGDAQLATCFRDARDGAGGGKAGFDAVGRAYVRFAIANPALFRLMMSSHGSEMRLGDNALGSDAFGILMDGISALTPPEGDDARRRIAALQSWSIVHGLATLMLDGQVPADDGLIDAVIQSHLA